MASPIKLNFQIYQGGTFKQVLRWESATKTYVPITNITKSAPVSITAPDHNIPPGWRVKVLNAGGMKEINNTDTYYQATVLTEDLIELNSVVSLNYTPYTSGGVLEYNLPVNLSGYTSKLTIADSINSTTAIYETSTTGGGIFIDNTANTITINIPASVTRDFAFSKAIYELNLQLGTEIIPFATGLVYLTKGASV
jgi:hypothetical protein